MLQFLCAILLLLSWQGTIYAHLEHQHRWNLSFESQKVGFYNDYSFVKKQNILKKRTENLFYPSYILELLDDKRNTVAKNIQKLLLNAPPRAGPLI